MSSYDDRHYFRFFSDMLEEAHRAAKTMSVIINEPLEFSSVERATVALVPSSLSIATSVKLLVREGYTPSARILVRPLLERVATLDFIVNDPSGINIWENGWKKKERPSLSGLLSRLDQGRHAPEVFQAFVVNDLNAVIHPDPKGLDSLRSPTYHGIDAHWFDRHPEDFDTADLVCSVGAMCSTFIASNLRRAFRDKVASWEPPSDWEPKSDLT